MALLCCLVLATAAFAGSVSGKITYDDKVPKLRTIKMDADPDCAAKHSSPVASEKLVLGAGNGLANVLVQIKNAPAYSGKTPTDTVVIDQKGCRYIPHVVAVMAGQPVKFKNSDGILHNVHGLPKVNREFNIGMPPTVKEKDTAFNKAEPIFPVKCDVHPWMKTFVAVMDHPYFAVSGSDGSFKIDGLPAGSYEVEAWHEKLGTQTGKLTVDGSGAGSIDFSFKIPSKK